MTTTIPLRAGAIADGFRPSGINENGDTIPSEYARRRFLFREPPLIAALIVITNRARLRPGI